MKKTTKKIHPLTRSTARNNIFEKRIEELASLPTKGRIVELNYDLKALNINYNTFGNIDGARLCSYDQEDESINIRINHSECPSFWLEIVLSLDKLEEWLSRIKKE